VYKATEGSYPYSCLNDVNATFIAKHTIKITKSTDGTAAGLRRDSKVTLANCSLASFVNYALKGTLAN